MNFKPQKNLWCVVCLMLLLPALVCAQTITVRGSVTDALTGEPLIGATVSAKGTSTGTVTDIDGNFQLELTERKTLTVSYVGYQSKDVAVKSAAHLKITLEPDAKAVDEVVVVAYGQQKKVTVTGAITNISGNELLKSPVASLGNAISGKLPGVSTVQYSGAPGADDPNIFIRGQASLNGSNPLVLVDGVERSFTQIDPNEVADITVLKDASATAVYGVRGANGVILSSSAVATTRPPRWCSSRIIRSVAEKNFCIPDI